MNFGAFATLLVSLAFAGLLYWVLSPRNKGRFQSYASIPLEDSDERAAESRGKPAPVESRAKPAPEESRAKPARVGSQR